jgi:hypothetical protein
MFRLKIPLLLVTFLFALPAAYGKGVKKDPQEEAAMRACLNGNPQLGVQILTDLYIKTQNPAYLFNQGRCYEQNNRYEDAINRFREFLRKARNSKDIERANVDNAEKHIAECEQLLTPAKPPEPEKITPTVPTPPPPPPPPPPPVDNPHKVVVQQPQGTDGSGLRIAGIVTAAVGGAALVTGLILNLKVNSMIGDLEGDFHKPDYSSSKSYKTGSQVGYGVGAACVAGGAILYYLGVRAGHKATLAPAVGHGSAGALVTGAF